MLRRFGVQPPGNEAADDEPELVPSLPPLRRGRRQQQQQHAREGGQRDADASPTTSGSHRSGSAGGSQASGGSALPHATLPQPILSLRQAQQAAAVQDLPGIGTWAGRYRLFGRDQPPADQPAAPQDQQQQQQQQQQQAGAEVQQPDSARKREAEEAYDQFGSPVVLRAGGFDGGAAGRRSSGGSYGSEQACEDAWRWRFSRWVSTWVARRAALVESLVDGDKENWLPGCSLWSAAQLCSPSSVSSQLLEVPEMRSRIPPNLCPLFPAESGPQSRRSFTTGATQPPWPAMTWTPSPSRRWVGGQASVLVAD